MEYLKTFVTNTYDISLIQRKAACNGAFCKIFLRHFNFKLGYVRNLYV